MRMRGIGKKHCEFSRHSKRESRTKARSGSRTRITIGCFTMNCRRDFCRHGTLGGADTRHEAARAWINSNRDRLVTSDSIVDEVLTLITARYRRQTAIRAGHVLFSQELSGLIQLTDEDKGRAWGIFRSHSDKRWSFTDCTSFALMQRLGISNAFSFDRHFSQMRGIRRVPN
jgi:uncharacterized protein